MPNNVSTFSAFVSRWDNFIGENPIREPVGAISVPGSRVSGSGCGNHLSSSGKKRGVQAINIYMRIKGTATWTLLAAKRTTFPFNDDTPPATAGKPEEREYMGMGVINDTEIGQPSAIVSAVFRPV